MITPNPIPRFERISTGTVDIHPQHAYGSRASTYWWILTSRQWLTGLPINVVGDVAYDATAMLDGGVIPGVGHRRLLTATTRRIRQLVTAVPDLKVVSAHDPASVEASRTRTRSIA